MKNSFSVFIVVLFCAVLCIGLGFLNRDTSDVSGWNPNELYSNSVLSGGSSAFTNATISGEDVNNVGVAVSMRGGSVSSSPFRHSSSAIYPSAVSLYAPASVSYGSSSMSNGVSPIAHMTSSAEYRSFGGGSNGGAAMGGSMRSAAASNAGASYSAPSISFSAPAISSNLLGQNKLSGDNAAMVAANNPIAAATSSASSYSDYMAYGSGVYGAPSRNGIRGRQNSGATDSWLDWLYRYGYSYGTQTGDEENGWYYTFSEEQLRSAFEDYIENYWDDMWGAANKPTFEQWLEWLQNGGTAGYEYNGNWYRILPIGDVLPLLILVLMYTVCVLLKSTIIVKLNNKNDK